MSIRPTMIFRLASKDAAGTVTVARSAQTREQPQVRRLTQLRSEPVSPSPLPDPDEIVAEIDSAMAELRRRAYKNAPRCSGRNSHHVQEWITVSQGADVFRMSKRILSTWTKQGLIPSIKGESVNSHRLVHIDGILAHMQRQLQISKEASLRVSQDDNDMPGAEDDSDAVDDIDLMQGTSPRASSPVIVP